MYLLRNEESEIPRQTRIDNYVKLNLYYVILKRVPLDLKILNCSIKRREKSLSTL